MRLSSVCFLLTSLVLGACGLVLDTSPPDVPQDGGVVATCSATEDCDDGLFCNGFEDCVRGTCQVLGRPDCDDDIACTVETCDEAMDTCGHTPTNTLCTNANEVCDPNSGCRARVFCMTEEECDDDNACTVGERCGTDNFCVFGTPTSCPSNGCQRGVCDPNSGACGFEESSASCVDDVSCTIGECGSDGRCTQTPENDLCSDGASCTEDVCLGIRIPGGDGTGCAYLPDDSVCDQSRDACFVDVCAPAAAGASSSTGCTTRVPPGACASDARCDFMTGVCEKTADPLMTSGQCSDGDPCNGEETLSNDGMSCVSSGHCPESTNSCFESICVIGIVRGCGFRLIPDAPDACFTTSPTTSP